MSIDTFVEEIFQHITIKETEYGDCYYWPRNDQYCWQGLNSTTITPDRIAQYVDKRSCVIQAGGNAGFYIKKYAEMFDRVYTFEPDPLNFFCLNANTVNHPNVIKFQACVGNERKIANIEMHNQDFGGIHVFEGVTEVSKFNMTHKIGVPVMLIDDLSVESCDLLQLDTEGYEYYALLGAEKTIDQFRPIICIEHVWSESRYGIKLATIEEFLSKWNYKLIDSFEADRVYKAQ